MYHIQPKETIYIFIILSVLLCYTRPQRGGSEGKFRTKHSLGKTLHSGSKANTDVARLALFNFSINIFDQEQKSFQKILKFLFSLSDKRRIKWNFSTTLPEKVFAISVPKAADLFVVFTFFSSTQDERKKKMRKFSCDAFRNVFRSFLPLFSCRCVCHIITER